MGSAVAAGAATRSIASVVSKGLCTRCGACWGACPAGAVQWATSGGFPAVNDDCTDCGLCVRVCGGLEVDLPRYAREHYGREVDLVADAVGPVLECAVARSTDSRVVEAGASGGLVTQVLLGLLEGGEIDGAVVCGYDTDDPLVPRAFVARSRAEILSAAQSKYVIFPVAHTYAEILRSPGRYAVVGLPCHFHSLFRWMEVAPRLRERIVLKVGLACHTNLEAEMLPDLLRLRKVAPAGVERFEFRGGAWPGGIRVHLSGGGVLPLHEGDIKDGAFNYLNRIYRLDRCLLCVDYGADLSDLAVADPWIRGEGGQYRYPGGWSVAMVRTERGSQVLRRLETAGLLEVQPLDRAVLVRNTEALTRRKKRGAFLRVARRGRRGLPCPEYHLGTPAVSVPDRVAERFFELSLVLTRCRALRGLLLGVFFSRFGGWFASRKAEWKRRTYRMRAEGEKPSRG